ncbi:MAG: hypothetical protein HYU29_06690 [Chloroflexi bacterium]|nr:hypothetical protein [Chloroflexota bacterium]
MIAYAGATWDFHRLHYDPEYARAQGLAGPIADGQMIGALLAKMLVDWAGPDAFLKKLSYRLRSMVLPGDRLMFRGVVTETKLEEGRTLVFCELDVSKQDVPAIVASGSAVVELPSRRIAP